MVSKDEAARLWKEHRQRTRERQKAYREEQKAAGRKQITCYLDPEPLAVLRAVRAAGGRTNTEVIGEAILAAFGDKPEANKRKAKSAPKSGPSTEDEAELFRRVESEMEADGATLETVAERLNAEGVPTPSGRGSWKRHTVDNFRRRIRSRIEGES